MKQLNVYSSVVGELPRLVAKNQAKTFIPYFEFLEFKEEIMKVASRTTHTAYQNKCYMEFLLNKIGIE